MLGQLWTKRRLKICCTEFHRCLGRLRRKREHKTSCTWSLFCASSYSVLDHVIHNGLMLLCTTGLSNSQRKYGACISQNRSLAGPCPNHALRVDSHRFDLSRRTISASESQRRSIQSAIEPQRRSNHNGTTGHNETTTTTAPITANQTTSVAQTTSGIQTPSTTVRSETPAPLPEPDFGFRNIGAPRPLEDETFYVMIYELPPFVYIASAEAVGC